MKYAALQDLIAASNNAQQQARRRYRLSERAHLYVQMNFRRSGKMTLDVDALLSETQGGKCSCLVLDFADLTAHEIAKAAEYRSMIADWESGKIDALPPSNLIDSPDEF